MGVCPRSSRSFATAQVQAGYVPGVAENTAVPPIHQSNAFEFTSLSEARDLFALRREGNIYSRAANPTVLVFEQRVAELEGGIAAAGVASGQAAVALALLALAKQGEHIVAARQLYGGTVDLLQDTFADWGIEVTFVDQDDADAWAAAVRPTTRALFAESITNPNAQVLDIRAVAAVARARRRAARDRPHGGDAVPAAGEGLRRRHRRALGDEVPGRARHIARRRRSSTSARSTSPPSRRAGRSSPKPIGASPAAAWSSASARPGSPFIALVKTKYVHDLGPSLSAFNAFQLLQGLETLDLRMARHSASGRSVSRSFLARASRRLARQPPRPRVEPLARSWRATYLPRGAASVFSFDVHSTGDADADFARVEELIARLQVIRLVANIGDARSLIAHPASMTHSHLTPDQLAEAGITPTTIRLSIGLEDPADLIADLERALAPLVASTTDADQSLSSAAWP